MYILSRPAASLGESSLLGALVEKLWLNSLLSLVGLQLVPVTRTTEVTLLAAMLLRFSVGSLAFAWVALVVFW